MDMPTIDGFNTFFVSKLNKENNAKVTFSGIGPMKFFMDIQHLKTCLL